MGYMRVITHLLTIDPNFQPDILVWDHGTRSSFQDSKGKATGPFSASAANAKGDHTGSSMLLNGNQMSNEKKGRAPNGCLGYLKGMTSYPVYMGIIS